MYSYCIMARKTRRRTQKRSRRRRGKSARKRRSRRRQRGGASCGGATESTPAPVEQVAPVVDGEGEEAPAPQQGGRRRKTAKKAKKGKKGKRKLNEFFKVMLKAKKAGSASFKYKGKTYKGRKHHRLGMVYSKA